MMDKSNPYPGDGLPHSAYYSSNQGIYIRYHRWLIHRHRSKATVILLGGRKEFLEKYIETATDLNQMGFDVYSFDWRGQGLSTRMLSDRSKGYIRDYDEYLQDLHVFFDTILPTDTKRPVYLLAHSMGAHLALRYLHHRRAGITGAILSAPMIDISTAPYPRWGVRLLIQTAYKIGHPALVVPGSHQRSKRELHFEGNPLTSDRRRFQIEKKAVKDNPDLAVDGITFAWLSATMASIDCLNTPGYLEAIDTPILMVGAGADQVVSVKAQEKAALRLPNCRLVMIPDSRHEILMETDLIRNKFWQLFIDFTVAFHQ